MDTKQIQGNQLVPDRLLLFLHTVKAAVSAHLDDSARSLHAAHSYLVGFSYTAAATSSSAKKTDTAVAVFTLFGATKDCSQNNLGTGCQLATLRACSGRSPTGSCNRDPRDKKNMRVQQLGQASPLVPSNAGHSGELCCLHVVPAARHVHGMCSLRKQSGLMCLQRRKEGVKERPRYRAPLQGLPSYMPCTCVSLSHTFAAEAAHLARQQRDASRRSCARRAA